MEGLCMDGNGPQRSKVTASDPLLCRLQVAVSSGLPVPRWRACYGSPHCPPTMEFSPKSGGGGGPTSPYNKMDDDRAPINVRHSRESSRGIVQLGSVRVEEDGAVGSFSFLIALAFTINYIMG